MLADANHVIAFVTAGLQAITATEIRRLRKERRQHDKDTEIVE